MPSFLSRVRLWPPQAFTPILCKQHTEMHCQVFNRKPKHCGEKGRGGCNPSLPSPCTRMCRFCAPSSSCAGFCEAHTPQSSCVLFLFPILLILFSKRENVTSLPWWTLALAPKASTLEGPLQLRCHFPSRRLMASCFPTPRTRLCRLRSSCSRNSCSIWRPRTWPSAVRS